MKKFFFLLASITLLAGASLAADDPLKQGMRLYRKHRFEEAFNLLYSHLPGSGSDRPDNIYLSLGMVCLENAKLYRELYRVSAAAHLDYLRRLISDKDPAGSRLAKLYLGKTLLQAGELAQAVGFFDQFIAEKKVGRRDRRIATIGLGVAYYLQGKRNRAKRCWSKVNTSDPRVMASLAAAYNRVGLADRQPAAMCARAVARQSESGRKPGIQVVSDTIGVYAATERIDEAYQLLRRAELAEFFHEETLVKNKAIRFYDPALLQNLAQLYGKAGLKFLETASMSKNKKINLPALYYLSEGYEFFGSPEQLKQKGEALISSGGMPAQIANRVKVRLAMMDYLFGNKRAAEQSLNDLLKIKTDPDLSAEILLVGYNHQVDFAPAVITASAIARAGEGKSLANLNFALGKYYLWKKDYIKAVSHMEAGRDKSNKNKVESNNLLMLVNLAEAYYRSKKFSEALEIFFEMSKHYPAVRQIQAAMQGIYSMEQQSAGDVKIF